MSDHAVFIAHADTDRDLALTIAAQLRHDGYSTWTYEEDGVAGVSYLEQVLGAIRDCEAVVLLLSADGVASHNVQREAETAYEQQKVIIPVRVGIDHETLQANAILRMTSGTAVSLSADGITAAEIAFRIGRSLRYIGAPRDAGGQPAGGAVLTAIADATPEPTAVVHPPSSPSRDGVTLTLAAVLEAPPRAFARYFRDLVTLVTGPKRFAARVLEGSAPLERAAWFLAISVAINFLLRLPFSRDSLGWQILRTAAFSFVLWTAAGLVIWVACRAAGGKGTIERTLAIAFYYFGVLELLMATSALVFVGTLAAFDPQIVAALERAFRDGHVWEFFTDVSLTATVAMRAALGVVSVGFAVALMWIVAGWGAFRAAHDLARPRSLAAFCLAVVFWIPLWLLTALLATALNLFRGGGAT